MHSSDDVKHVRSAAGLHRLMYSSSPVGEDGEASENVAPTGSTCQIFRSESLPPTENGDRGVTPEKAAPAHTAFDRSGCLPTLEALETARRAKLHRQIGALSTALDKSAARGFPWEACRRVKLASKIRRLQRELTQGELHYGG